MFTVRRILCLTRCLHFGIPIRVFCRMMGFDNGTVLETLWPGSGPIWLDEVDCTGEEDHLQSCSHSPWGEHNCNHYEDVAIRCFGTTVTTQESTTVPSVVISATRTTKNISTAPSVMTRAEGVKSAEGTTVEITADVGAVMTSLESTGINFWWPSVY